MELERAQRVDLSTGLIEQLIAHARPHHDPANHRPVGFDPAEVGIQVINEDIKTCERLFLLRSETLFTWG